MLMSTRTRSGLRDFAALIASEPEDASVDSYPNSLRIVSIRPRMAGSSSTTRIIGLDIGPRANITRWISRFRECADARIWPQRRGDGEPNIRAFAQSRN